jgi:hypothetical protein
MCSSRKTNKQGYSLTAKKVLHEMRKDSASFFFQTKKAEERVGKNEAK